MSAKIFTVILVTGLLLAVTGLSAPVLGPLPVTNPTFDVLPPGGFTNTTDIDGPYSAGEMIPGWTTPPGNAGQFQPAPGIFNPGQLPTPIIAWSGSPGSTISQTVANTVEDDVIYTLMVDLGFRNPSQGVVPAFTASADLLVGGPGGIIVPATGTAPASGDWSTFTAVFRPSAADIGKTITIQLNSSGNQAVFADVQLAAVPEPGDAGLAGLGLAGLLALALAKRVRRT